MGGLKAGKPEPELALPATSLFRPHRARMHVTLESQMSS